MLKKPIKASQIANLTDARYFAAWDVNWLGFCLDTSADYFLKPQEVAAIREWVEGPKIVGEFGIQSAAEVLELARLLKLDAVQVGPFADPSQLEKMQELTLFQEWIIETTTNPDTLSQALKAAAPFVNYFVLNFSKNGIGWSDLNSSSIFGTTDLIQLCRDFPILLDLHLPSGEIEDLLEKINPYGLSIQGGAEEKVGVKSFEELDDLLEALEILE